MDFNDFAQLCTKRRTVHGFDDRVISDEDLQDLLRVAHLSPSVGNTQPWRFHVVLNKDLASQLNEAITYGNDVTGGSAFVVVTAERLSKPRTERIVWNPHEIEYSCVAAMTYLLLAAVAKGLDANWVSLQPGPVHDILKLPQH